MSGRNDSKTAPTVLSSPQAVKQHGSCLRIILPSAFIILHSAFCLLPSAFIILPSAFILPHEPPLL